MNKQQAWFKQHGQKIGGLIFWSLLIGGYFWYTLSNDLSPLEPLEVVNRLVGVLNSTWGPLLFIAVYALRPLIFFSATVLTLLGGFVFGSIFGIIYTIIGANTSAMVAYLIGRFFGSDVLEKEGDTSRWQHYIDRMRNNSFETVLLMRLIFLPYDLVNYLAGFLRINWKAFLLATAIGSLPGTISFVLLGDSFSGADLSNADISFDPVTFGSSIAIIVVSIGISRFLKRREAHSEESEQDLAQEHAH